MHSIDNEINRLIKLKEEVENCKKLIQKHSDVLICSESYFHNCLGVPGEAGQMVFVVSDELADFIWDK